MRFSALLKKELRESLPWMLLAAIILLAIGGFLLRVQAYYGLSSRSYSSLLAGNEVDSYQLIRYSPLKFTGPWLLVTSIGLGLALGVRHFWITLFTKTWAFLIHRSVSRQTILGAKLAAATLALVVSLGAVWIGLYSYAGRLELFTVPPPAGFFIEGWLFIVLGLVVYLGTALTALSTARWYTTKIFGLAFATVVVCMIFLQWRISWAFAVVIIGIVILLSQIIETFLNREF
ncbi:MAG: hypothetical protein GWN67_18125 [Phycisphaerae bacterium]|nr:hypothetical protein [Phycisphaerae bacterium]NIP55961.1 hypothetical protein [Phycisphaerae bacterium]NIS54526.1 hypothetical protein [Phycisphaerae bacterium]NIU12162.1 hypothetical protein [Phycisphaerae bacterium]NIU58229.1 hypothetical protein [Phycisphaerae bacterium]